MTLVIIIAGLLLLAAGGFIVIVGSVIKKSCPSCGPEQFVAPIIPGLLAWCPECGETYRQEELLSADGQQFADDSELQGSEVIDDLPPVDPPLPIIDEDQQFSAPEEHQPPAGPPRF